MRRPHGVMEYAVNCHLSSHFFAEGAARVQVEVISGEVATSDFDADAVS